MHVWQKSMDLVTLLYDHTSKFPRHEVYGLTSQMRRSAISIPSNLAEGSRRNGKNEYRHFVSIAFASGAELETQIEIAQRLRYAPENKLKEVALLLDEIMKMLRKLRDSLS